MRGVGLGLATAFIVATLIICLGSIAVFGILKFEWYYAGKESFLGNFTSCMDADGAELWIALFGPETVDDQKMYVFEALSQEWKKTVSGVNEVPIRIFRFILIAGSKVLIGGPAGGAIFDRGTGEWEVYTQADGLPSNDLYSAALKDDEIWFGTNDGIAILDGSGSWQYYTAKDGLPDNKVLYMVFDGAVLWICTEKGIGRLDTVSDRWETYTEEDGLPGEVARMALVDRDYVWFAMKGGVARLDKKTIDIEAYTVVDGLLSGDVRDVEVLGDRVYFATDRGVSYRNRLRDGKWMSMTTKQGLPLTGAGLGLASNVTHLAVQGDQLWIALWSQGIVRMSRPSGLAVIPRWVWVMALPFTIIVVAFLKNQAKGEKDRSPPNNGSRH